MISGKVAESFAAEAVELVARMRESLRRLRGGGEAGGDAVDDLLRAAHTLKGAARIVGRGDLADGCRSLEELVLPVRGGGPDLGRSLPAAEALVERIAAGLGAQAGSARRDEPAARVGMAAIEGLMAALADAALEGGAVAHASAALDSVLGQLRLLVPGGDDGQLQPLRPALDRLHALADDLRGASDRLSSGLDRTRSSTRDLRMAPLSTVVHAVELALRDAAAARGRRARLVVDGSELRFDAAMQTDLQGMLIHLVRNAVAHGVEDPAARRAAGKPDEGSVALRFASRNGRLVVVVEDDGRGLSAASLRDAAVARGLLTAVEAGALGEQDALHLAFRPSVTTATSVDDIAGRGLGLDAVHAASRRLGGSVAVDNHPGRGARFTIDLPATWSARRMVSVADGGVVALVPLSDITSIRHLAPAEAAEALASGVLSDGSIGRAVRLLPQPAGRPGRPGARRLAIITPWCAVLAERIAGTAEAVIRPVPAAMGPTPGVAGIALDASGQPSLMLDAESLGGSRPAEPAPARPRTVLIVDDSVTTRMLEQSILEGAGFTCALAASGEEALAWLRTGSCDLLLVDLEMPGIDGIEVIRRVRADARHAGLPCIMVSSRSSEEDRRRAIGAGAADYVVKGRFDQADFLSLLRRTLP